MAPVNYYLVFNPLYPWIQKTKKFPGGIPEKLVCEQIASIDDYIEEMEIIYFDLVYVYVLSPQV